MITFATTVATLVNGGQTHTRYYSQIGAPLYGAGLREGSFVTVQDQGSQWVSVVESAVIEVQVVGRTEEWVRTRQQELLDEVIGIGASEQEQRGIPINQRIVATVEPLTKEIAYVEPNTRTKAQAAMALLAAALIVGSAAAWTLEHRHPRKRSTYQRSMPIAGSPVSAKEVANA
ncbi:hypothetical protein L2X99_10315 [Microbacterium sp. KUDC0406]|uniref:hypothetical protein n=1 Tax=Microbacterium sp. KUDC0406 TaxID=2909588 RepID=UPI001F31089F|nr:hypothetical protein [Microbacterium sp. KUDC0406]UJP08882.1 hypothetical protein L2X99_10315 [Microbacterium sp. KUDC0406]